MKEIRKITTGYVVQSWDATTKEFLGQEFVAGDQVDYEDDEGNVLTDEEAMDLEYRCFDMVQTPPIGFTFPVTKEEEEEA